MKPYLAKVDTKTSGNRADVTPLFADREAFSQLAYDLAEPFLGAGIDAVVAIDALGFILGTAIAERIGVGVVPARKGGKLPVQTLQEAFVDYSGQPKALEMREDVLTEGMNVLIVDEWVETGAQVTAAIALVERLEARVGGIATICMDRNASTSGLRQQYTVHTVWDDERDRVER
jgi:adenine phosphoribosyltransferase